MKQCPKCQTTYPDVTLSFCLADGSVLNDVSEQATFIRPTAEPIRVQIPPDLPQQNVAAAPPGKIGSSGLKIVLVVGLLSFMLLAAAIVAGALIYFNKDSRTVATNIVANNDDKNANRSVPANSNTNSTVHTSTDQLREQIANLEKRLNEQKNSNRPVSNVPTPPDQPVVASSSARVNSPGDGFLAMRSLPNSELGSRVTQIPHGTAISLNGCLARTRLGNKTGRWCRTKYGGYSGWVFDAWLTY